MIHDTRKAFSIAHPLSETQNASGRRSGRFAEAFGCEEEGLLQVELLVERLRKISTELVELLGIILVEIARRTVVDEAAERLHAPEAGGVLVHNAEGAQILVPDRVGILADAVADVAAAHAEPARVHDSEEGLALQEPFKALVGVPVRPFLLEHALHVALRDGVGRVVPVRIGKDDVVGCVHILLLDRHVGRRLSEAVLRLEEGFARDDRIEADGIEVAELDFAALVHKVLHRRVDEIPFNGFVARIADDKENALRLRVAGGEAVGFTVWRRFCGTTEADVMASTFPIV